MPQLEAPGWTVDTILDWLTVEGRPAASGAAGQAIGAAGRAVPARVGRPPRSDQGL